MAFLKFRVTIFIIFCIFFLASCSGGGGDGASSVGTVSMSLMDSPNGNYQAVYVTILKVETHKDNGPWMTVGTPNKIYNLLELVNGVMESLGIEDLPAGKYTQVRLILGDEVPPGSGTNELGNDHPYANYVIDNSKNEIPIKVPSGFKTGIKLVHWFAVEPNSYTELILDFDAMKSIVETGNGKLILKPTIKVIKAVNYAVSGLVTDEDNDEGIPAVRVSSQIHEGNDNILIEKAATYTDGYGIVGYYRLPVVPNNTYNLVAFREDYTPKCQHLDVIDAQQDYTVDFSLTKSGNKEIPLDITFASGDQPPFPDVKVEFIYLDADCGADAVTQEIIVESIVSVYDESDSLYHHAEIFLPYGNYKLIASAQGYEDFTGSFKVIDNEADQSPIAIDLQQSLQ